MESHDHAEMLQGRVARSQLEEGIFLAQHGDRDSARAIFTRLVHRSPEDEQAWLWLAYVAETPEKSLRYLSEARAFLPESEGLAEAERQARERYAEMTSEPEEPGRATSPKAKRPAAADAVREAAERAGTTAKGMTRRWDTSKVTRAAGERLRAGAQAAREMLPGRIHAAKAVSALAQVERWAVFGLAITAIVVFLWLGVAPLLRARARAVPPLALADAPPVTQPSWSAEQRAVWAAQWDQMETIWSQGDWSAVENLLDELRQTGCPDEAARKGLAEAYRQLGLEYLDGGLPEDANRALNWAVRLDAGSAELQDTRRVVDLYLQGMRAFGARDWAGVVSALRVVERLSPDFRDTRMMLATAYYHEGERLLAEASESETAFQDGVYDRAKIYAQRALEMRGNDYPEADDLLVRVNDAIFPPRRIEVDLSEFLVTAYENHQPVRTMVVCVGRASAPTMPGRYKIMNKDPMAYATQWDLKMPHWLGIYYVGDNQQVQNGFHALPFLSSGARLWTQALGTRCSFGCIVLGVEDAEWLYNWADVGTVVIIKP
ncbi:MAG: L,D-transpeptidase family protein [Anaerolineae bacterium]|nr:L,D-transpeptidase family protein [Anaerolineae bacterium]